MEQFFASQSSFNVEPEGANKAREDGNLWKKVS